MAWATEYRLEFSDNHSVDWKVDIESDGFAGTVTDLVGAGTPLVIDWENESDDFADPLRASRAYINVWSQTNFALAALYSAEDMKYRVSIYEGETLKWQGYIVTQYFEEPYECPPYQVTITACCGLELLKNYRYYDTTGSPYIYYDGRRYLSQIILDILGKIGITTFKEFINIYEASMVSEVTDSPLDQLKIDVDVFRNRNSWKGFQNCMYCDEVLREILKIYNANIIQKDGYFFIYRPVELKSATVYGRLFTAATTKTGISITPSKDIYRSTQASDLRQIPGGQLMVQSPASVIRSYQDYGNKDSWLDNWDFKASSYNPYYLIDPDSWAFWTGSADTIAREVPEEADGVLMYAEGSRRAHNIYQQFGTYALATSDVIGFSFDYYIYNYSGGDLVAIYIDIKIKCDGADQWLKYKDEEDWEWVTSEDFITITTPAFKGRSSWVSMFRTIASGLPKNGPYTITIYTPYCEISNNFAIAIKNVKFFSTNDEIQVYRRPHHGPFPRLARFLLGVSTFVTKYIDRPDIIENSYDKVNAGITGREIEMSYILGDVTNSGMDNVVEQFAGSLSMHVKQTRVDIIILTGTKGSANITVNGVTKTVSFITDLSLSAASFVGGAAASYDAVGITLTNINQVLHFTAQSEGVDFDGDSTITNLSGDLSGNLAEGTAFSEALTYTEEWNTRGGSESKELIEIIVDEVAAQYARPKQLVQMVIADTGDSSSMDILGCFEDDLNEYSSSNRKFVFNRGSFDIKSRRWDIDFMEVI
jgi:hypothetical protein